MAVFSFDIVSDYDKSELNNVVDQAQREIANRYDLKGTKAALDWLDGDKNALKITGDNDFHIDAILDIVRKSWQLVGKAKKRSIRPKRLPPQIFKPLKLSRSKKDLTKRKQKK